MVATTPSRLPRTSLFQKRMTRQPGASSGGCALRQGGALVMLAAIDFDDQLFRPGCKIGDVRTDRHLPIEADACDWRLDSARHNLRSASVGLRRSSRAFSLGGRFRGRGGGPPSVPSRLREGMRCGGGHPAPPGETVSPSRRREGLGEGATFAIDPIHQPHSTTLRQRRLHQPLALLISSTAACRAFSSAMTRPMSFMPLAPISALIASIAAFVSSSSASAAGSARSPRPRPFRHRPVPDGRPVRTWRSIRDAA